ncbi:hypothetical protein JCM13664_11670 [Methylothermus subterraneus]
MAHAKARPSRLKALPSADPELSGDPLWLKTARPICFRTDARYLCTKRCRWAKECKKLIAEWLR